MRKYGVYNHLISQTVKEGTREECVRYIELANSSDLELYLIGETEEPLLDEEDNIPEYNLDDDLDDLIGIL